MDIQSFQRSYQIAPIILVDGIAAQRTGGLMSILALTEGDENANYADSNEYFAHFKVMPGGTLIDYSPAEYPYASQAMAANAMIKNALRFSVHMDCPARNNQQNYSALQQTITRLQQQLDLHNQNGGSFNVATPGFVYTGCLLVALRDVTSAGDKKVQAAFQWEFVQPLVTQQAAEQTFNSLYAKLAGGLPVSNPPTNSGVSTTIGNAPSNQPPSPTNPTTIGPIQ